MLSSLLSSNLNYASELNGNRKEKAHFILVHGGWQGAWNYYKVENTLKRQGYEVTVLDLPAHGKDTTNPSEVTLKDYEDKVTSAIDSIEGKVILVGHGTLAPVVSMAAEARPNKVEKLIYIAGVLVTNGQTLEQALEPNHDISIAALNSTVNPEKGTLTLNVDALAKAVYNMSPKADIEMAKKLYCPEPLFPLLTPITLTDANYGKIPRYYIKTLHDNAVVTSYQEDLLELVPCKKVYEINSDHAAFFSKPNALTKMLVEISKDVDNK